MHREFNPTESPFQPRSNLTLYLLTGLLAGLVIADLWPVLAGWLQTLGLELPTWSSREWLGFRFALMAAVIGGARSLYLSLENLTEGKIGADLAIALAAIAAILIAEPLVAAEVVLIALLGECLEAWTFDRTQRAVRRLAELFPTRCWVLRDGQEVRVFTRELVVGDRVVVKPGGKVPADGTVLSGIAHVNMSALTGESLPVEKQPGDSILAGSIVQDGALTIDVKQIAESTVAGQIIELTAAALRDKGPGERLADRLARYFLPVVLLLAAVTFAVHVFLQTGSPVGTEGSTLSLSAAARLAVYPTLAVLVVACPCPLVLATPAAVLAALGRLAGTGVLVKGGSTLERLAQVRGFAFDKTGTLTEGVLELGDVHPYPPSTADELLQAAATAEQSSEHPLARVVLHASRERSLSPEPLAEFSAHPGGGITARTVSGSTLVVGNRRLLVDQQISLPPELSKTLAALDDAGQTVLLVARDGQFLGAIGARDRLRPEAPAILNKLRELGIDPLVMLTGDRVAAARAVAERLPPLEIHAELLPSEKAEWLARHTAEPLSDFRLFKAGSPSSLYAFVGDGVNDAPALARASVGIAIASGSDIAAEAGDVVMMGEPLKPLPMLIRLSRETARVIRQNILWFGFGVNLAGVLITGWLWPFFATNAEWFERAPLAGVLYHQLGSLAVLLNSMRLLAFERHVTSPTLTALREFGQAVDRWASRFHPDELLHELSHHWKPVSAGLAVTGLIAWGLSGVTQVNLDEVGVVQRFGAVRDDLTPGLHLRWPWPIETVTKLSPSRVHTLPVGFRILSEELQEQQRRAAIEQEKLRRPGVGTRDDYAMTWASAHADSIQRLTDESLMITGDGNLVEILATVRYRVEDPKAYLFRCQHPEAVIRSTAEAVFRELTAGEAFLDVLTRDRGEFELLATQRLVLRLDQSSGGGLGIRLDGLTIHDLHPPQEVVAAYHQVAEAIQQRDRRVNEAEAEATRIRQRAAGEKLQIVRQAIAAAAAKIAEAQADRDAFLTWVEARNQLTSAEEAELATLPDAEATRLRAKRLAEKRVLTEFRLALQATVAVLRGRDKLLIDADSLPGRRQLLLVDPQTSRLPAIAFPRSTSSMDPDSLSLPPAPAVPNK